MMKRTLLLLFLCCYCFVIYAQHTEKGIIRGKVVEEVGGLPIPGAVVSVSEIKAEVPLVTFQTDADGFFKFDRLKGGSYKIKISFIGFNTVIRNDITISTSDFDQNIGTIKLLEAPNSLNEVTISSEKPLIETDGDVITYNVGSSIHAEGSSAVDILKDVPMVEVDIDGKPSIVGMRSTRVFINGKPSDYMTSNIADLLNVLPSDAIEKIEVMTNPPAKYSADGEGVINLVLRKDFKVGFNGTVSAGAGIQGDKNAGINASYKGKNYSVNGGGSARTSTGESSNRNFRTNNFPDTTYYYNQFNNTESDNAGKNLRGGLNWDITKNQNLRISTNWAQSGGDAMTNNDFYSVTEELLNKRLQQQKNGSNRNAKSFVFNTDYDLRLDTIGNKLTAGFTANTSSNSLVRTYDRTYIFPVNLRPSLQQNDNQISNSGINLNLDYEKSTIDRKHRIELGMAIGIRQNRNDLLVENYNFSTDTFIKNLRLSNDFLYHEQILATYASYNYRLNGWTAKAAVRAEYTNVTFDLSNGTTYNLSPYWNAFPSFSISRYFKKKYNLALTYGMRINRPRENTLNPQINDADTMNITFGNPHLKPSITNQFSLNFSVFGQDWSFNPRIAYSRAVGLIERFRVVHSNGVSETTFDNVGSNAYISYILLGNYRPTKKTSFNGHFTLIQNSYRSTMNKYLNRSGYSIQSRAGVSIQIAKSTAFEGSLNYANNLVAQGRNKSSISTSFGAKQNFFKNRLTFRISSTDPFRAKQTYSYNEGQNFNAENYQTNNTNNVNFQLIYRYTKIKVDRVKIPPASKVIGQQSQPVKK